MQEIEVKARVKKFSDLIQKLESMGCRLSKPIVQKDTIFVPKGIVEFPLKKGTNALRIREQDGEYIFTLKQPISNELDNIEREVKILDPKPMEDICKLLGFYESARVNKSRKKCRYKDYEICLDEVEGLGNFIEVEKMTTDNGKKVQEELYAFLETLGIKREDREEHGYDVLMWLKAQKH